jgi:hypothetical protein
LEPVPIKRAPLITLVPICRSLPGVNINVPVMHDKPSCHGSRS